MNSLGLKISSRGVSKNVVARLQSTKTPVPAAAASKPPPGEIVIPFRKERGPTDILRALEKTIKRDPTAPRYKYHDDPFLIPYSTSHKRNYALAQEAGRRAAMWIRDKHAIIFPKDLSNPVIEKFLPRKVYTSKDQVSEDILKDLIRSGEVEEATKVYKLLEEDVSVETKQDLFELLCFYNNSDPLDPEMLEEKWHKQSQKQKAWKMSSDVENLFEFLKSQSPEIAARAYNCMIYGYVKYLNGVRAWVLFEEALKNDIPVTTKCFNRIIQIIPFIKAKENVLEHRQCMMDLLQKMYKMGHEPNTETLNSCLRVAASIRNPNVALELTSSLFTEFKKIGVQPNLTSYYFLLHIVYSDEKSKNPLILSIINEMEGKEFKVGNKLDTHFFVTAMNIAANNLEDPDLGDRIHQLLLTGDNCQFLGDNLKESLYYRNYFMLQIQNQSLEDFIKLYYDLMVPNIYTPEPIVMDAILNSISVNDPEIATAFLPRFWSHMVQFSQLDRKNLVEKALNLMRVNCKPAPEQSEINKMYSDAAWTVWKHVENQKTKRIQKISWDGPILGDIVVLLARNDDLDKCAEVIAFMVNHQDSIVGMLKPEQIEDLLNMFLLKGEILPSVNLIHYCVDVGYENTPEMALKVYKNFSLNEWQLNRLRTLVPEVFKTLVEEKQ